MVLVIVTKIAYADNIIDPFTKTLASKTFDKLVRNIGLIDMSYFRCN